MLKAKGGKIPQIPNDTRRTSDRECYRTLVDNRCHYMEIYDETKLPFVKFIDNRALLNTAKEMLEILDCVNKALNTLQADYTDMWSSWCVDEPHERWENSKHTHGWHQQAVPGVPKTIPCDCLHGWKKESDEDLPSKIYEETHYFVATINLTLPGFLAAYQMEDEDIFPVFFFNQEVKKVLQPVKYWQFAAKQCAEKQGA